MKKSLLILSLSIFTVIGGLTSTTIVALEMPEVTNQTVPAPKFPTAYAMSYDANGGEGLPPVRENVEGGRSYTVRDEWLLNRQGYLFSGWNSSADGTGTPYQPADVIIVTKKIIFYAQWKPISTIDSYAVTFESNGGTAVASIENIETGSLIQTPIVPIKSGFEFTGWYKESVLTTLWNFDTDVVTENIRLYAKWSASIFPAEAYTVEFDSNEGTAVASIIDVATGSFITEPTKPTKTGYMFTGWYKDVSLTNTWNFDIDVVVSKMTLYAKWVPTVTIEGNNTENENSTLPNTGESVMEILLLGSFISVGSLFVVIFRTKK